MSKAARQVMITFRVLAVSDADLVARIDAESLRPRCRGVLADGHLDVAVFDERPAFWRSALSDPSVDGRGVLALDGCTPAGFAFARLATARQPVHRLDVLHLLPGFRGRGIGCELLAALSTELRDEGPVQVWVCDADATSRRFYDRLGAVVVRREHADAPGGARVPASVLGWRSIDTLRRALLERASRVLADDQRAAGGVSGPAGA